MTEKSEQALPLAAAAFGELRKNWGWLLAVGILFVVLGTIGMGMTFTLTIVSVLFFGVLLLIGGGVQVVDAFKCKGWKSVALHVLIGVLYVLAAILLITRPALASSVLTLMLAGAIIGVGVLRIVMALQMRGTTGWGWALFSGIVSLVLGALIIAKWPVSGLWVIGMFVAIEMILHGWSYIFIALAAKNAPGAEVAEPAPSSA